MNTTLEIVAALSIAMVCNDMPAARRALNALDACMSSKEIGELLARLDQMRAPAHMPSVRVMRAHAA
jgi:hypothetical protein